MDEQPRPPRRRRGAVGSVANVVAAVVAAMVVSAIPSPAAAATSRAPAGGSLAPVPASPIAPGVADVHTVTLITGDVVTLSTDGGIQRVDPAPGRDGQTFAQYKLGGHRYVVPRDALPLLSSGDLDRRLFDVTGLVSAGLDDQRRSDLPLLVSAETSRSSARQHMPPTGTSLVRSLPELGLDAVLAAKRGTAQVWAQLSAPTAVAGPGVRRRIWLNGQSHPSLDLSVPQIGAPVAWRAGYTGKGVTVAVLDTGLDSRHPDFVDAVSQARDFTGSASGTADEDGHGTHVASIVAGRGTASAGRYVGVAPGAKLLIGKVCTTGGCPDDALLAGMQWAASSGAAVVNVSLSGDASDGNDPVSQRLNELTRQYGTLFVAAAGNGGTTKAVSWPAAADEAVAVASVSRAGVPSSSSSRGPREVDEAVKPDIAAPGEGIVAARAAGTGAQFAVNDSYVRGSGTSAAAPHVAGAAAIIRSEHPDWGPRRVKAALMGGAQALAGTSPYEVGTGRVDLARATTQQVTPDVGSLSFGLLAWPHPTAVSRTVTYHNDADVARRLRLHLTVTDSAGLQPPSEAWQVDREELTVQPHGEAAVNVTFDPTKVTGRWSGWLVATSDDGGATAPGATAPGATAPGGAAGGATVVRTAVGGSSEEERHSLHVQVTRRDGKPDAGNFALITALGGDSTPRSGLSVDNYLQLDGDGSATARLPEGRYAVLVSSLEQAPGSDDWQHPRSISDLVVPTVELTADRSVSLDARLARPVTLAVAGDPSVRTSRRMSQVDVRSDGVGSLTSSGGTASTTWYSWSSGESNPALRYVVGAVLQPPAVRLEVVAPLRFEVPVEYAAATAGLVTGDRTLALIDVGEGRPEDLAGRSVAAALAVVRPSGYGTVPEIARRLAAAGAAAMLLVAPDQRDLEPYALPTLSASAADAARLLALAGSAATGPGVTVTMHAAVRNPAARSPAARNPAVRSPAVPDLAVYNLVMVERRSIPVGRHYLVHRCDLAELHTDYRSQGRDGIASAVNWPLLDGAPVLSPLTQEWIPTPTRRTEYFSAAPVGWVRTYQLGRTTAGGTSDPPAALLAEIAPTSYRPGQRGHRVWGSTPLGPSLDGGDGAHGVAAGSVRRRGDQITAQIPPFSPAHAHGQLPVAGSGALASQTGSLALSSGGSQLGSFTGPSFGSWRVPATSATYELRLVGVRRAPQVTLATEVRTTWEFPSGTVPSDADTTLPLMTVTCDPVGLDLANSAPAANAIPVRVDVRRQALSGAVPVSAGDVRELSGWISLDDGASWQVVPLRALGEHWVLLVPPRTAPVAATRTGVAATVSGEDGGPGAGQAYVSLRVRGVDDSGSSVDQTMLRAYRSDTGGR